MFRNFLASAFILLCSIAAPAFAESKLIAGNNIEFLVLNGREVTDEQEKLLKLSSQTNQIALRYSGEVRNGSKTAIYTSRPYLFEYTPVDGEAIIYLRDFKTLTQVKAFFKRDPEWMLKTSSDKKSLIKGVGLTGTGFAGFSNMEKVVAKYNKEQGIILEQSGPVDIEDVAVEVKEDGKVEITGDALTQLKLWYTKASKEERKTFRKWMVDQD
ncbi:DUF2057 domain-containing protein [Parasalinivibrio latis]|uniref:YccT family protein n=1 Tax=Parasalinivibrio latis TaxID=2952610 RepID=UPI0030E2188D